METASQLLPIIMYTLISILVIFIIIFVYKLTLTLDKTNIILDDVLSKIHKLDNLFDIVDRSSTIVNSVTNKVSDSILIFLKKLLKKRKDDNDE